MPRVRPPLPPKSGTAEDENYIGNPEVGGPVIPPKGDVQTGNPVGPMFTKMPRQDQRQAVNKTFDQMVADARQSKGSVFDTKFDKALRFGSSDEMGGISPQSAGAVGVVVPRNAARGFTAVEKAAQDLWRRWNPKLLNALEKDARPGGEYILDLTKSQRDKGYTLRPKKAGDPIEVRINPKLAGPETFPHEADHAFAFRRNPRGPGSALNTGGMEVLDPEVQQAYRLMAGGDPFHAATYYRADEAAKRTGRVARSGTSLLKSVYGKSPEGPAR